FANNLPRELSRDYFCGFFHRPDQVREIFRLKNDFELTASHIGRCLIPNLMAANSSWHPVPTGAAQTPVAIAPGGVAPPDPAPLQYPIHFHLNALPAIRHRVIAHYQLPLSGAN